MSQPTDEADALTALLEQALRGAADRDTKPDDTHGGTLLGEVVDTHHPHLAGRIFVKWLGASGQTQQRWLEYERTVTARVGARVLMTRPVGWPDLIVVGVLGPAPGGTPAAPDEDDAPSLRLAPGQALSVHAHDGTPLVRVRLGHEGPSIELCGDSVEVKAKRRLTLSADTVEIRAADGGVDVRTDGDAIVRGRFIRLN